MLSLTYIFDFLFVYLRFLCNYIFGGQLKISSFFGSHQREIAYGIFESLLGNGFYEQSVITFPGEPLLMLVTGIFACFSIISLVRRLTK